jgi:hypothetical protein
VTTRLAAIQVVTQAAIMFAIIKITGMTRRTGAGILRMRIADVLVIIPVTVFTAYIAVMITRVVAVVRMIVLIRWYPAIS